MSENKHNKYIELALRAKIAKVRPDFPSNFSNKVVDASMANGNEGVSRPVLLQAIDLAVDEKDALSAENARLRSLIQRMAEVWDEMADRVIISDGVCGDEKPYYYCAICESESDAIYAVIHAPSCPVTKWQELKKEVNHD